MTYLKRVAIMCSLSIAIATSAQAQIAPKEGVKAGEVPAKPRKIPRLATREAAKVALAKKGAAEFAKTPLAEACKKLEEQFSAPIELDEASLKDAGVALSTPVTLEKKEKVTLKEILNDVLKPLNLGFTWNNGALLVTTLERIEELQVTVSYSMKGILPPGRAPNGAYIADWTGDVIKPIEKNISPGRWEGKGGNQKLAVDYDRLELKVTAPEAVQEQVEQFLVELRKKKPRR